MLLGACAAVSIVQTAHAQVSATWTSNTSGSWGNPANWSGGIVPGSDGDTADFTLPIPGDVTVTLDAARTIGALEFGSSPASHNWIINGGSNNGNLQLLNDLAGSPMITVNGGTTATINADLNSPSTVMPPPGLMIGGGGTLVLNGKLNFSGPVEVNSGVTQFSHLVLTQDPSQSGPGPSSLKIDSGAIVQVTGTLAVQGSGSGNEIFVSGGGTLQLRNANSSLTNPSLTYGLVPNSNADCGVYFDPATTIDVGNGATQWITGNSNHNNFSVHNGDFDIMGNIVGSAGIAYSGAPYHGDPFSLSFWGDNSGWTGSLTMVQGSLVPHSETGHPDTAIGANNAVIFATPAGQAAVIYLYGENVTIGSLSSTGAGSMSIVNGEWYTIQNGQPTPHSNGAHTIYPGTANLTVNQTTNGAYAGILADGPSDRADAGAIYFPLALTKTGPATLTLTGNNTYSGGTTINAGVLEAAGSGTNPLGTGPITVNSGGTLKLTQSNIFGNGISVPTQTITINGGTLTNNGSFNALGPVMLNGGTIAATAGKTPGQYEAFSFNGGITTVASSTASMMTSSGTGSGYHLSANTIFNIAQGTTSNGQDLIVSGNLLDQDFDQAGNRAGGLTKSGAGTLVLAGNNTYTGATNVNGGTLLITGSNASPAAITVSAGTLALGASASIHSKAVNIASGGLFDVSAAPYTLASGQTLQAGHTSGSGPDVKGSITAPTGSVLDVAGLGTAAKLSIANNLTLSGGTVRLDLAPGTPGVNSDVIAVGGNLTLSGSSSIVPNSASGSIAPGTYTLFTYGGTLSGAASNLGIAGAPAGTTRQTFTFDTTSTPKSILLGVTGNAANLIWAGNGTTNNWDVNTTSDWKNGSALDKFFNLDSVTFDDSGSTTPAVNIAAAIAPASLTVNSSHNYTFGGSGSIGGSTGLTKSGSGTLTITTSNSFAGAVNINGGTVSTPSLTNGGAASPLGAGSSVNLGAATLSYTGSGDSSDRLVALGSPDSTIAVSSPSATLLLSGPVSGSGGLTKVGAGTLSLSGPNTYAGTTTINAGTLAIASDQNLGAAPSAVQNAAITLNGGNLQFTGGASLSANRGITLAASATLDTQGNSVTIAGPVSGTAPTLTKVGSGTLALTGGNTFTANTVIGGGTLVVPGDSGLGAPASLILQNGGTVAFTGSTDISPDRNITLGSGGGNINSGGNIITIHGTISGGANGPLGLVGGGTFTLTGENGASTYAGGTTIDPNVKSLTLQSASAAGTGTITFQGPANLEVPFSNDTVSNAINAPATGTFTHWETLQNDSPTLAGKISGGNPGLQIQFNLSDSNGQGGIILTNSNNDFVAQEIDLNRGAIGLGANGVLGNPNNLLFLDVTISGAGSPNSGLQFLAPGIKITNPLQFGDYTNINVNGHDGEEIAGNISGPGGSRDHDYWILGGVQNGGTSAGSLRLSGNNTFTQNVSINTDTTLIAGSPTALGTGNTITVTAGASLAFDGAGVMTNSQKVNLSGDGVMKNGAPAGALLNISGNNRFNGAVTLQTNSTIGVANSGDTLTLTADLNANSNALTKVGAGTLALAGPSTSGVSLTGLTINGGTVKIGSTSGAAGPLVATNGVTINTGGKLALPSTGPRFVSQITGGLTISGTGMLDVGISALTLDKATTPTALVAQYLKSGYNGGAWNGSGINSSAADASHGVGYADGADGVVTSAGVVQPTALASDTVLVKYTFNGDANLDGKVDFTDLVLLARHYGHSSATWDQGDFNYDGSVGFDDLVALARNYGKALPAAQLAQFSPAFQADVEAAFAQVPEPATFGMICLAMPLALRRRRR